jgi:hypothetical protein
MQTYKIADLLVALQANGKTLTRQTPQYLSCESRSADITIALNDNFLQCRQKENPHLSFDECEYIWTGIEFYRQLLNYNGMMLHASALAYEGRSYLFSAPCGTGKSTHARLWQEHFGFDNARIINDDKPALRFIDNSFYVYGTPWSGKSEYSLNLKVPLQAICFLEQSTYNWIIKLESKAVLKLILNQTLRPHEEKSMENLLILLDKLIREVPVYKMGCNIDTGAVAIAYEAMASGRISASAWERV